MTPLSPLSQQARSMLTAIAATVAVAVSCAHARDDAALDRVVVIGASASAGFGSDLEVVKDGRERPLPLNFADVLDTMIVEEHHPVPAFASALFFMNPMGAGKQQVKQAHDFQPTLVVAVDFLFWFGYGRINVPDGATETDARLELLEHGIELLNQFEVPTLVGDFSDMSDAVGRMLSSRQVPSPDALAALNKRVHAWIETEEHVTLVGLSEFLADVRAGKPVTVGATTWQPDEAHALLIRDRLHPSGEGLIAAALLVGETLVNDHDIPPNQLDLDRESLAQRVKARLAGDEPRDRLAEQDADTPPESSDKPQTEPAIGK